MNQKNSTVDNDLQKAIDDITNSTNIDPVFADSVAAPAIAPAVNVQPATAEPPVPPTPVAPSMPPATAPTAFAPISAMPFEPTVAPGTTMRDVSPVAPHPAPKPVEEYDAYAPVTEPTPEPTYTEDFSYPQESLESQIPSNNHSVDDVKIAALRDLAPLLSHMSVDPSKKISLYEKMVTDLHDSSVIPSMYDTIKELPSDKQGDALLNLIDTIDNI